MFTYEHRCTISFFCCSPTNTDVPFSAEYCTPTNVDALSTFTNGVTQCLDEFLQVDVEASDLHVVELGDRECIDLEHKC